MQKSYFLFLCLLGQMTAHTLFAQESPKLTDLPAGARFYTASLLLGGASNNAGSNAFRQSSWSLNGSIGGVFYRANNKAIYAQVYSSYGLNRWQDVSQPNPSDSQNGESGISVGYRVHKPVLLPGLFVFAGAGPTAGLAYGNQQSLSWNYALSVGVYASGGLLYAFNDRFQLMLTAASLDYDARINLNNVGRSQSLRASFYPSGNFTLLFRPG
jgi:hypothetical protein